MAIDRVTRRFGLGAAPARQIGDPRFATMLTVEETQAPQEAGAAPRGGAALMASALLQAPPLQGEGEDGFARQHTDREARRHGLAMLKALGAVQLAMLAADDDRARQAMTALADAVRDALPAHDAALRMILREIGIRAAVELARGSGPPIPPRDVSSS